MSTIKDLEQIIETRVLVHASVCSDSSKGKQFNLVSLALPAFKSSRVAVARVLKRKKRLRILYEYPTLLLVYVFIPLVFDQFLIFDVTLVESVMSDIWCKITTAFLLLAGIYIGRLFVNRFSIFDPVRKST